ncbi:enoyl-CoA hydratase [Clostridium beijerinckii]|nr:enoyl-CoA hydratase [Clostridium beijerinckii]
MKSKSAIEGREMAKLAQKVFSNIENMPQVVIAAVNGYALGGGCELSMACDIRLASTNAKFGQPEVGLGIIPGFAGTQRLPRLVGKGIAKELIFTTDMIDAKEAYRIGLVNKVYEPEELMEKTIELAKKIMKKGLFAVSLAKSAINNGLNMDTESAYAFEADLFGLCFSTDDQTEGMSAFIEKRKALFKGC